MRYIQLPGSARPSGEVGEDWGGQASSSWHGPLVTLAHPDGAGGPRGDTHGVLLIRGTAAHSGFSCLGFSLEFPATSGHRRSSWKRVTYCLCGWKEKHAGSRWWGSYLEMLLAPGQRVWVM